MFLCSPDSSNLSRQKYAIRNEYYLPEHIQIWEIYLTKWCFSSVEATCRVNIKSLCWLYQHYKKIYNSFQYHIPPQLVIYLYLLALSCIIALACQQQLIEVIDSHICRLIQHVDFLYVYSLKILAVLINSISPLIIQMPLSVLRLVPLPRVTLYTT